MRLAQVHVQREQWEEAIAALERALEKGELEDLGDAYLLMGIARYNQSEPERARSWFRRALEYEDSHKEAKNWLSYIDHDLTAG